MAKEDMMSSDSSNCEQPVMGEADCRIASIGVKQLLESLFKEFPTQSI